jgi:alpha-glucosidase
VLKEGATERAVYLPKGDWYDYWTGRKFSGGATVQVTVTLENFPLFVRGGAFIFRQPVVQNTGEMPGKPLRVLIAPATESESTLYEDDGKSLDYRKGDFLKRRFHQTRNDNEISVDISAPQGSYRPASRDLVLEIWTEREPKIVSIQHGNNAANSTSLPRLDSAAFENSPRGWTYANGTLTVKDSDAFDQTRFTIRR